jgi:hypothetical protein
MQNQEYPVGDSKVDRKTLRRLAIDYYLNKEVLYKRSFNRTLVKCLNEADTTNVLQEIHEGICSTHANRHMMARKIQKASYFWMMLERDVINVRCITIRSIHLRLLCLI